MKISGIFFKAMLMLAAISAAVCCSRSSEEPSPEFSKWVKAYSGGIIDNGSTIKIMLTAPMDKDADISGLEDSFSFSPDLKGDVRVSAERDVIEFIPEDGAFRPGTRYDVSFRLSAAVKDIDRGMEVFRFSFMTKEKTATVSVTGIRIPSGQPEEVEVSGIVEFSVPSDADAAGMLSCRLDGQEPEIAVGQATGANVPFKVTGIRRGSEDTKLEITFDGREDGYRPVVRKTVRIPRSGLFEVMSADIAGGESPYVDVIFSMPLDRTSDPEGLIVLENAGRTHIRINDNIARIYYEKPGTGDKVLKADAGVRSEDGQRLGSAFTKEFRNDTPKPAVELLLKGNILPDGSELVLPFKAVNLSAVDVTVIRIFEDNIPAFLQENDIDGDSGLRRAGRLVARKTVRLDTDPGKDLRRWQDFAVDLSGLFRQEPGSIYRIRLSFKQEYSLYGKTADGQEAGMISLGQDGVTAEDETVWDTPAPYYYENFYDWDKYDWNRRDDPGDPTYYMMETRFPVCNLLSTRLGVMAKLSGSGTLWVTVNDILTARPVKDAEVTVCNYQLQPVGKVSTDKDGFAEISLEGKPFVVKVSDNGETTYLKVTDGNEISLSRFDTGGTVREHGLKAFIYGDRGVWRPGDTLHVTMIVEDRDNPVPDSHPVTMELYTPQGQFHSRLTDTDGMNGFHVFHIPTAPADPTGTWNAYFKIGGSTFHKPLMIESIKPNRLKINLDTDTPVLHGGTDTRFELSAAWLTGPAASGLEGKVEMSLVPGGRTFKGYDGYVFSDPTSSFTTAEMPLFGKTLDKNGKAAATVSLPTLEKAPGMLQARLISRVSERGGDESVISKTMLFSPYEAYVGIRLPETDGGYIETDTEHRFPVIVTDADGKPVSGHRIEYRIFRLDWSWWWESKAEGLDSYVNGTAAEPYSSGTLVSSDKPVEIPFRLDYPEWGRFLVYVKDVTGGHSTGGIILADWPAYRGRSDKRDPDALTMLTFSTGKKEYEVGETATVYVPAARNGLALVSLENATKVISRSWVRTSPDSDTPFRFTVTEDMAPDFYVHISLLRRHSDTEGGLPSRMYGVQPVMVLDKDSHLYPQLSMPDEVRPLEEFTVTVSERDNREMTYTLAIVDEGLLDLTAFRTPDPWSSMYAREALGVRTWDMYDEIIGAFGGRFVPVSAIGGDQTINKEARTDNRFNPVVRFMGPFTLKGKSACHKVTLPMYVGSVRVMLVAGKDGAYGNAEKTVPVRTPLMVLPTLPRTLSDGDKVVLPVNVFAMEKGLGRTDVSVKVEGAASVSGPHTVSVNMEQPGDTLVRFSLSAAGEGTAKVTVTASGGGYQATETVSVPVRNPNPDITSVTHATVSPGESHTFSWKPSSEECRTTMELAGFPAIDFNSCFNFLQDYGHECSEQLSAAGITIASTMGFLSDDNYAKAKGLVPGLLSDLYSRQLPDGGFATWPGQASADEWTTSMAGHFMILASDLGYEVNSGVLSAWKNFQRRCVRNWRHSRLNDFYDLVQAYRLYTLALAGSPEQGAMNRMKESEGLSVQARWELAAAYAVSGKERIASEMTDGLQTDIRDYSPPNITYGSALRDKAMILEVLVLTDRMSEAMRLAEDVAGQFSGNGWYTTQLTAFTASAMARLAGRLNTGAIIADISQETADREETVRIEKAAAAETVVLEPQSGKAEVTNLSEGPLYVSVSATYRPDSMTRIEPSASGIELNVSWSDPDGNPVNPHKLMQGTDVLATLTVSDITGVRDHSGLALTFPVPSGWEISNERTFSEGSSSTPSDPYTYMDIRDDKVMIYFDLSHGTRKKFRIRLRAAYKGTFIFPSAVCEAMYDPETCSRTASGTAEVL